MKKFGLLFLLICCSQSVFGQVFHFINTETTLVKTTNQSPAHWYIQIYSDVNVDTTLRWKAHFINVPSAWHIGFDDGTTNDDSIADLDSNDFVLFTNPPFPQKLIIGNMLHNTVGNGSVCFDIFNPEDRSNMTTICYHFIISQGTAGIAAILPESLFVKSKDYIEFIGEGKVQYVVYDGTGKRIFEENSNKLNLVDIEKNQLNYIEVKLNHMSYIIKVIN